MKIYTRTGDKGETSLYGGKRISKASLRVESYGTIDELNSILGVIVSQVKNAHIKKELILIQHDLLVLGSTLANPEAKPISELKDRVGIFESLIDTFTKDLPQLRNFILPGGGQTGAFLHLARTICRRVERRLVELSKAEDIDEGIIKYFNRLSDLLFTMARYINFKEKKKETIWIK